MKTSSVLSLTAMTAGSVASVIPQIGGLASNASGGIFVSSYDGNVYQLTPSLASDKKTYNFDVTKNTQCGDSPSWLQWDRQAGELYCLNENVAGGNGTISKYDMDTKSNSLQFQAEADMLPGPVSGVPFGEGENRALAVAHYSGHGVSVWSTAGDALKNLQELTFTLDQPGPVPGRQDAPYEHEVILDPTGNYILTPDLGADLVRVFSISKETSKLTAQAPLEAEKGTGPRHGVFWSPAPNATDPQYYFFLTQELTSTVTSYSVTYGSSGLTFDKVGVASSMGDEQPAATTFVSEIHTTPDGAFVIVANRGDASVKMNDPNPANSGTIQSDSLVTFKPQQDGTLESYRKDGAGGSYPRQFAMNKAGDLVGVPMQFSESFVLLARDPTQGVIGPVVGFQGDLGNATCAQFYFE